MPTVNQLPYGVGFAGYYGGRAAEVVTQNKKRGVVVQARAGTRKRRVRPVIVRLRSAERLRVADFGVGSSDPFVLLSHGASYQATASRRR